MGFRLPSIDRPPVARRSSTRRPASANGTHAAPRRPDRPCHAGSRRTSPDRSRCRDTPWPMRLQRPPACHPGLLRQRPRSFDRSRVIVVAGKCRVRIRTCHDDGGSPVPAAHVSDFRTTFQPGLDALQCGNPTRNKVSVVSGTEKLLRAFKQPVVVLVPAHAIARS